MNSTKVRKCLFPAAGYGTRFLPATKAMPKEMLPILDKPLIQYGVEEALDAGMDHIAFVTGRNKRAIEDYFDINYEVESKIRGSSAEDRLEGINHLIERCTFSYTRQIVISGLGHAILTGETLIGDAPFGVVLADDLCVGGHPRPILSNMVQVFQEKNCNVLAIQKVPRSETNKYGIVAVEPLGNGIYDVRDLVEKPNPEEAPSNFAIIGRYVLKPSIFTTLRNTPPGKGREVQITDALRRQLDSERILACEITGQRFDCGSIDGFFEATKFFYEARQRKR
jgi:UTP--glucose-1-phosphate uridylyltransferase